MRFLILSSRALLLLAVGVLVPACGNTKNSQPPVVIDVVPRAASSSSLGQMTNILVKFDRDMDAGSVQDTGNWALSKSGAPSGVLITVEYLPALHQARIIPSALLENGATYGLVIGSGVKSANGVAYGITLLLLTFDVTSATTTTSTITWTGATAAATPPTGQIVLTWSSAQESSANIAATYDVYLSTTPGGADLMGNATATTTPTSATGTTITGLTAGATYYIKVQPRDSAGAVFTALTELTAVAGP